MMRRQTWIGWMLVLALAPAWADYADERQALLDQALSPRPVRMLEGVVQEQEAGALTECS